MSKPIGNMVIKIDLNSSGFNKSMTGLNRQIKSVNTEMKANLSQFNKAEKSTEKYGVKIDSLTKRHQVQEKAVEAARKKYDELADQHGVTSAKAEAAAIEVNKNVALYQETGRELDALTTEFKNFEKQQAIQNSSWTKTGDSLTGFGKKLGSLSADMTKAGKSLTKKITLPALGAASALGGIALVKGFQRLVGIDTARAKLIGLGHDAEGVELIMTSALDSVKGTAFGMDEAATTAAGAVAAGVKPGKDLTKYLTTTGDAAAIAGVSLGEMGSIFNKVETSQVAYTDNLNQLADRGIPIYQWLAEEAGASMEEVKKMTSDGKISSEMFLAAVENNIGGAAQKIGENSFTAGMDNMWSAVGRLGANFLDAGGKGGGFFSTLKPLIGDFTSRIDDMGGIAEKAGVKFGDFFTSVVDKVKSAKATYDNLSPTIQNLINKVVIGGAAFAVLIGPLLMGLGLVGGVVAKAAIGFGSLFTMIGKGGGFFTKFAKPVADGAKKVGFLGRAFALLSNPVGWVIAAIALLTAGFIIAYKKSETFRNFIHALGDKFKEVFGKLKELIQPGIDAIVGFFGDMKNKITEFMSNEGAQLIEAFQNIGSVIAIVAGAIWTAIKWAFDKILAIIEFIMPAVLFIINMVWGNIKGLITGVLDVIMGAVKVFSGLFTGDFSKMWEGVKQMFVGAVTVVWNYINLLFIGRILKGIGSFVGLFGKALSGMWTFVKGIFTKSVGAVYNTAKSGFTLVLNTIRTIVTTIRSTISNIWNAILNIIKSIISNIWKSISATFTNVLKTIRTILTTLRATISSIWNAIFTIIKSIVTNIWTSVKNIFTTLKNGVTNLASGARTGIVNQWTKIKSSVTNLASGMWTAVKKTFTDMVNGAKALPGRIGTGIKNAAGKAADAMKSMGNKMLGALEKPINGMITGVNWVTDKLGIKKKVPKVELPRYAKGTTGHPGGGMIVGDKYGRELVTLPSGESFISPDTDTLLPNMPKGTKVLPNRQTEELLASYPHYAKGTGWASKALGGIKDIWGFMKNPASLMSKVTDGLGIGKISGFGKDLGGAAWDFAKNKPLEYIKKMFSKSEDEGNAPGSGKPAFSWPVTSNFGYRTHPIFGDQRLHAGTDYGAASGSPIPSTTGGKVSFAGRAGGFGNLVKVKNGIMEMFYAHMSKIMVSAGQSVKKGSILGLVGSTGNSTGPHLHYETHKNGRAVNPMGIKGFATGGLIKKKQMAMLAEDGHAEIVIPTDPKRRTDAMKLLALTGRMLGVGGGSNGSTLPSSLPSVKKGGKDNNEKILEKMLNATLEQNQLLMQMLNKDNTAVVAFESVYNPIKQRLTEDEYGRNKGRRR